ncbi:hypothetical protein MC7420_3580 [Coleofasciculus chthonoplastes PCC 7420]|uniref:Uncharacterized protein n=1 Tax=Coleofasciculus chthonoplastes PCC 7420 TaxID=118168 RepID=B4W010_9CYAN|nr:hypothetical protein MC7420_3580 [Coleofasciculus chthonoplastes PCC 7420]
MLRFFGTGKPVDASLFLAQEKGNRILLLPSCSPLPSLGEGLGVRAGVGEGLSLS